MIGIKGIAKKPITDATASTTDVLSGKVFYNNTGKCTGELSSDSILFKRQISVSTGKYNNHDSTAKIHRHQGILYEVGLTLSSTSTNYPTGLTIEKASIDSDTTVTGYRPRDNPFVIIQEGNFQDETYEPVGLAYVNTDGVYRKIIVDDYLSGGYTSFEVDIKDIKNSTTIYDTSYNYYTQSEPLTLTFTDNFYQFASLPNGGAWSTDSCYILGNIHIDLFFRKRS